ncbi:MAG: purine-nucleoside phosphorylase, partial [Desulfobacterales bacterium]
MPNYKRQVVETADFLNARIGPAPVVALLTGTGLGESVASLQVTASFAYQDLPHFPVSTVESHHGRLLAGTIQSIPVLALQGRFHLYEGYSPTEVTFPIRVIQELGVKNLILSNAAGGLQPDFKAGDIMLITDHINLTGANPLVGPNEASWGIRFPDMSQAYDRQLINLAEKAAAELDVTLHKGVYVGLRGPSLETPAEIRFLKTIGAAAVGLSTVQEVIAAVHAGIRVLGLSTITNLNNPDDPVPATVEDILAVARKVKPVLEQIIAKVVVQIGAQWAGSAGQ